MANFRKPWTKACCARRTRERGKGIFRYFSSILFFFSPSLSLFLSSSTNLPGIQVYLSSPGGWTASERIPRIAIWIIYNERRWKFLADEISSTLSFFARYIHAFNQRAACQLSVKVGVLGNRTRKWEISGWREEKWKGKIIFGSCVIVCRIGMIG